MDSLRYFLIEAKNRWKMQLYKFQFMRKEDANKSMRCSRIKE